jgi:tetratricopeptide (TPR) repeat protein
MRSKSINRLQDNSRPVVALRFPAKRWDVRINTVGPDYMRAVMAGPRRLTPTGAVAVALLIVGVAPAVGAKSRPANPARTCNSASGDGAIAACTRAIESGKFKGHNLATLHVNRGVELSNKGELDRAIADYDKAIALDAKYALAYNGRGNAYRARGDNDRAIADYGKAIELNPELAVAFSNRGDAYRNKGDFDRAIADYDQAIRLNPKNANAYSGRGSAYRAKGDDDRAKADYDQAIHVNPKSAFAYYSRGNANRARHELDRAIADYQQAIRIDPNFALAYNGRGLAYRAKGDADRAIADYDQAIRLDPDFALAYSNRGDAYRDKDDPDRAIADYNRAIARYEQARRVDPNFAVVYNGRGNAYQDKQDNDRAITDYTQAIKIDPRFVVAYNNRALIKLKLGQLDDAIADYDAALRLDPKQARPLYGRGIAKLKKGDGGGHADIAAAQTTQRDIAEVFARAGVVAPGSAGSPPAPTSEMASTPGAQPLPAPKPQPTPLAPVALPQASVKSVFEKHSLLGIFAWDCSKPASKQNHYFVHRLIDADHVQRDVMDGPTTRAFVVMVDKAAESKPNEITVSGTRDGKPFSSAYRIEPAGMRVLESTVDGKVEIAGGRLANGAEMPLTNRCTAPG